MIFSFKQSEGWSRIGLETLFDGDMEMNMDRDISEI
jgi:hypothetical protein